MRRLFTLGLATAAALAALVWAGELGIGPVLITHEDEQKMVLFFGEPVAIRTEPGVWWRLPLLTDVRVFDNRYLYLDAEPREIQTRDEERLVVDNYVVWRIADPLAFYRSFPQGLEQARSQIDRVVRADVRAEIGRRRFAEVLTDARVEIMQQITEASDTELRDYGIEVRDVRINQTELPRSTEENVFARMRAERQRLARKYRAEGEEEGRRIRAEADREARVVVAEAERDAQILRGEGDAEAARIYAEAHSADAKFYAFVRSLEAYRNTLGERTTLVLSPDSEFFRLLGGEGVADGAGDGVSAR